MEKPFTRRGVLFTLNSLYDPWGLQLPLPRQIHLEEGNDRKQQIGLYYRKCMNYGLHEETR